MSGRVLHNLEFLWFFLYNELENYQDYMTDNQKFKKQNIEQDSWISELAEEILN